MQVAKAEKHINFTDLNVPISSSHQLAAPSTPDTVREAVLKKAAKGKVKHKEVVETVRDTKPKSEAKPNSVANAAKQAPQTKPESTLGHPAERAERVRQARLAAADIDDDTPGQTTEEQWQNSVWNLCGNVLARRALWNKLFGADW